MRGVDPELVAELRDVSYPHTAPVVEVDDFGRLAEAQHVGRQHSIPLDECRYRSLPADLGADAELATVQQNHRFAVPRLQVASDQPVDHDRSASNVHETLT
jgi:hypothetical protein